MIKKAVMTLIIVVIFSLFGCEQVAKQGLVKRTSTTQESTLKDYSSATDKQKNEGIEMNDKDDMETVITDFLSKNIGEAGYHGQVFSAYTILGQQEGRVMRMYIWALCQEYYLDNGRLGEGSTISLPVALDIQKSGANYKITDYKVPRDGTYYTDDLYRIFPKHIRKHEIFSSDVTYHNQVVKDLESRIKTKAKDYFNLR